MTHPPDHSNTPRNEHLSSQTLHELVASLSVIKGQTQLLERHIRHDRNTCSDKALARLAVIDTMVVRIVDRLDHLRDGQSDTWQPGGRDR